MNKIFELANRVLRRLIPWSYVIIVLTNQRGIARGTISKELVDEIHRKMIRDLARQGARIDDVLVCPHADGTCDCRKPKTGLLFQARAKWNLDFATSLMIGDSDEDAAAAEAAGVRFLRVDGRSCLANERLPPPVRPFLIV